MERLRGAVLVNKAPVTPRVYQPRVRKANNASFPPSPPAPLRLNVEGSVINRNFNGNYMGNTAAANSVMISEPTRIRKPVARKMPAAQMTTAHSSSNQAARSNSLINRNAKNNAYNAPERTVNRPTSGSRNDLSSPSSAQRNEFRCNESPINVSIINKRKNALEGAKTFTRTLPPKQMTSYRPDIQGRCYDENRYLRGGIKQRRAINAVSRRYILYFIQFFLISFLPLFTLLYHLPKDFKND